MRNILAHHATINLKHHSPAALLIVQGQKRWTSVFRVWWNRHGMRIPAQAAPYAAKHVKRMQLSLIRKRENRYMTRLSASGAATASGLVQQNHGRQSGKAILLGLAEEKVDNQE